MNVTKAVLFIILLFTCFVPFAQDIDSSMQSAVELPQKYYAKVDKKMSSVDERLTKKSIKYLAKFQKQEAKL